MKIERKNFFVGFLFSQGECVWQSQDNEKCQRTKDKDKKCYQRWWSSAKTYNSNINVNVDDRSGKTRQNILFEVWRVFPDIFFKLTRTTFSCLNLWHFCKPKLQVGGNIINNGRNTYDQIIRDYLQLQVGGPFEEVLWRDCEQSPPERRWVWKSRKCKKKVKLNSKRIEGILTVST